MKCFVIAILYTICKVKCYSGKDKSNIKYSEKQNDFDTVKSNLGQPNSDKTGYPLILAGSALNSKLSHNSVDFDMQEASSHVTFQDFVNATIASEIKRGPLIKIKSIETHITVSRNTSNGLITDIVSFEISNGIFSSIIYKLSLEGTSDKLTNFRVLSTDVKLQSASIITNCNNAQGHILNDMHMFLCLVSKFEEVEAVDLPQTIVIAYEYTAENLLKKREKPFSTISEEENVIIWIFETSTQFDLLINLSVSLSKSQDIDLKKVSVYPEKGYTVSVIHC